MASSVTNAAIRQAAKAIKAADAVMVTAGAGIGVDSGLPDFRGTTGFWREYPELASRGIRFEQMANPEHFSKEPALAWGFYGHRLNLYRSTTPHAGFGMLLDVCRSKPLGGVAFTSNVDGQFQAAGFDADSVVECHGSLHHLQCLSGKCCGDGGASIWSADGVDVDVDPHTLVANTVPTCGCTGSHEQEQACRPNVLMFNDTNWVPDRTYAQIARMGRWFKHVMSSSAKLVVIDIGSGKAVPTVRRHAEFVTETSGGTLVRINPRDADVPSTVPNAVQISLGCLDALTQIQTQLQPE